MNTSKLDSNQKGLVAEKHLEFLSATLGWDCLPAHKPNLHYDYAVLRDKKEGWQKVQVKFAGRKRSKDRMVKTDLRRTGNRQYSKDSCDLLYTYDPESNRAWLIPWAVLKFKTEISPATYPKYEVKIGAR